MSALTPLILASASPRRLALLQQAGIAPQRIVAADVDETPTKAELPATYVARLALAKAHAAHAMAGDDSAIILAADTTVALGRRILGKAATEDEARKFLTLLSGRRHRVLTAVCVLSGGKARTRTVSSVVRFKRLTSAEIDAYIASGEWKDKAGAYAIQGLAAAFIPFISGSYSNTVGLPIFETVALLKSAGHG